MQYLTNLKTALVFLDSIISYKFVIFVMQSSSLLHDHHGRDGSSVAILADERM